MTVPCPAWFRISASRTPPPAFCSSLHRSRRVRVVVAGDQQRRARRHTSSSPRRSAGRDSRVDGESNARLATAGSAAASSTARFAPIDAPAIPTRVGWTSPRDDRYRRAAGRRAPARSNPPPRLRGASRTIRRARAGRSQVRRYLPMRARERRRPNRAGSVSMCTRMTAGATASPARTTSRQRHAVVGPNRDALSAAAARRADCRTQHRQRGHARTARFTGSILQQRDHVSDGAVHANDCGTRDDAVTDIELDDLGDGDDRLTLV